MLQCFRTNLIKSSCQFRFRSQFEPFNYLLMQIRNPVSGFLSSVFAVETWKQRLVQAETFKRKGDTFLLLILLQFSLSSCVSFFNFPKQIFLFNRGKKKATEVKARERKRMKRKRQEKGKTVWKGRSRRRIRRTRTRKREKKIYSGPIYCLILSFPRRRLLLAKPFPVEIYATGNQLPRCAANCQANREWQPW